MRLTRYLTLSLSLFGFWLILSGIYRPLILSFGVFSTLLVTYLAWRMDRVDRYTFPIGLTWRIFGYVLWLVGEIFRANLDRPTIVSDGLRGFEGAAERSDEETARLMSMLEELRRTAQGRPGMETVIAHIDRLETSLNEQ